MQTCCKRLSGPCGYWRWLGATLYFLCLAGCAVNRPIHYRVESQYQVRDPAFAQTLGQLFGPPLVGGNRLTTFVNGDAIFPAMLAEIRAARRTINCETYIYWSGTTGRAFTDAFIERARAGVKVRVLLDWFGSVRIDAQSLRDLRDAGVDVRNYHAFHIYDFYSYRQINHRTHRKLLIIDGRVGFTGGVGIADTWSGHAQDPLHWRDNHYRIAGPAVGQLQAAFVDNWMQTTGEVLHGDDFFPAIPPAGDMTAQVVKSSWLGGAESMELLYLLSFAAAGQSVRIENAYFVPDALTRRALIAACRRGVRVEILVPGPYMDKPVVLAASRAHWGELLRAGAIIYEYQPTMLHAKVLIVDDLWVSVGSSNLDSRSFRLNDEANLNVLDAVFAAEQVRIFEADKTYAHPITYQQWKKRPWEQKWLDAWATLWASEF